jgi:hypothetical protein
LRGAAGRARRFAGSCFRLKRGGAGAVNEKPKVAMYIRVRGGDENKYAKQKILLGIFRKIGYTKYKV